MALGYLGIFRKVKTLEDSHMGIGIGKHNIEFDFGRTLVHGYLLGFLRDSHGYMDIF